VEYKVSVIYMRVLIKMIYTIGIKGGCPTFDAVDLVAFFEE
jgi:hypothetical protein